MPITNSDITALKIQIINTARIAYPQISTLILAVREHKTGNTHHAILQSRQPLTVWSPQLRHAAKGLAVWEFVVGGRARVRAKADLHTHKVMHRVLNRDGIIEEVAAGGGVDMGHMEGDGQGRARVQKKRSFWEVLGVGRQGEKDHWAKKEDGVLDLKGRYDALRDLLKMIEKQGEIASVWRSWEGSELLNFGEEEGVGNEYPYHAF